MIEWNEFPQTRAEKHPVPKIANVKNERYEIKQSPDQEPRREGEFLLVAEYAVVIPSARSRMRQHFMNFGQEGQAMVQW
jgi:hypothetical protein